MAAPTVLRKRHFASGKPVMSRSGRPAAAGHLLFAPAFFRPIRSCHDPGFRPAQNRVWSPPAMPTALLSPPAKKVGMISLGCAKNLVDAEIMLGSARAAGLEITADADEADVLIVNTCAFIDSAKEESIEAILDAHRGRGLKRRAG